MNPTIAIENPSLVIQSSTLLVVEAFKDSVIKVDAAGKMTENSIALCHTDEENGSILKVTFF
jgi:hypothetical protein